MLIQVRPINKKKIKLKNHIIIYDIINTLKLYIYHRNVSLVFNILDARSQKINNNSFTMKFENCSFDNYNTIGVLHYGTAIFDNCKVLYYIKIYVLIVQKNII